VQNIPKPPCFVLAGNSRRHGHVSIVNGASKETSVLF
jgi:hypothetical protein